MHFVIIDRGSDTKTSHFITPTYTTGSATATSSGSTTTATGSATTYGGQLVTVRKPRATNTIVCCKGVPEGYLAYDAMYVVASIRKKYGMLH